MSHKLDVDTRYDDFRPYPARHRATEERPVPVEPPAWANEHARPIPHLPGEGVTQKIRYPDWRIPPALPMPLPARAEGAALEAETVWDKVRQLGRALRALRVKP